MKTIIGLSLLIALGSTGVYAQTFYQSVDRDGNITLSDRPMIGQKIVKRYNINIQDPIKRPQIAPKPPEPYMEDRPAALKPISRHYNPAPLMEETLVENRIRDAVEYRDCLDTNRSDRKWGAALEVLCEPRRSVLMNTNETAMYQYRAIEQGFGRR